MKGSRHHWLRPAKPRDKGEEVDRLVRAFPDETAMAPLPFSLAARLPIVMDWWEVVAMHQPGQWQLPWVLGER